MASNRTLLSLYVNPLVEILERQNPNTQFYNGTHHGVFDEDPSQTLTLLIDLKTNGPETWPYVISQLKPLRERGWLTHFKDGKIVERPITVVGTGNTPFDLLTANETYRDTFFDAPLDTMWEARQMTDSQDLPEYDDTNTLEENDISPSPEDSGQGKSGINPNSEFTSENSYYASVSFGKAVGFMWRNHLSHHQMQIIRGHIRGAHRRGLKVRYWNLPSWPIGLRNHVWDVLVREGVDMLNVDDLRAASKQVW